MRTSLIALTLCASLLAACKEQAQTRQAASDPTMVTAPASLMPTLKLGKIDTLPVSDTLRVAGRIDYDEQRVARIGAPVTGRVMSLEAEPGRSVRSGETLAQLHSTELGNYQLAFLKARAQVELHTKAVERARQLLSADVIGGAELQRRQNELDMARAEMRAAADQLRVLGLSDGFIQSLGTSGNISSLSPVVATLSGVVVERKVTRGQVVQPTDALFTVADLSQVWVVAQVTEGDAGLVQTGQTVEVDVPALGGKPVSAKIAYVGDIVNPESRTVAVRAVLPNTDRRLKPAMLATMLIQGKPQPRPVVPATAVVREENEDHVFVSQGENRYRLVKVKLGPEQGGSRVVLSGLLGPEQVVVDGAFHLNNERKRAELEGS